MLIALIFLAWISLIAICWAVCVIAQRGDTELGSGADAERRDSAQADDRRGDSSGAELATQEDLTEPAVRDARRSHTSGVR